MPEGASQTDHPQFVCGACPDLTPRRSGDGRSHELDSSFAASDSRKRRRARGEVPRRAYLRPKDDERAAAAVGSAEIDGGSHRPIAGFSFDFWRLLNEDSGRGSFEAALASVKSLNPKWSDSLARPERSIARRLTPAIRHVLVF